MPCVVIDKRVVSGPRPLVPTLTDGASRSLTLVGSVTAVLTEQYYLTLTLRRVLRQY